MITLAVVLGSVGAMLMLVGLVGGGFSFSGSVMPKVGTIARTLSFSFGSVLVLSSLMVVAVDPSLGPTKSEPIQTAPTAIVESVPAGYDVPGLLRSRPSFTDYSDQDLDGLARAMCSDLRAGSRGRDEVQVLVDHGISTDDAIYALAAATTAYCPAYADPAIY
jgi:Protein of unknown function (DUF732)